jgi:elongation factor P
MMATIYKDRVPGKAGNSTPMATTSDFKKGMRIELDGDPYAVEDYSTQTPSARGASTLIKAKLERIKEPDFEIRPCQYLYNDGETHYFMDDETYEQHPVQQEVIAYELGFLRPNDPARAVMFEGQCIGVEVPPTVILEVTECEPAVKGDTVTAVTKAAKLETGLEVQVPMFVEQGDKLVVDTRDARYIRRA